jgi:hypothetical protein
MPLQPNGPAPYTTAAAVTTVLTAWRERGLGVPITADVLTRCGVAESLARRTFQSLCGLDLLNDDGTPTDQFQDFRAIRGTDEYQARLQEWLRSVYADVLQYADPSSHSYDRVTEAFRSYEPSGQRRAMASLLLGLWKHAGLPASAAASTTGDRPSQGQARKAKPPKKPTPSARRGSTPAVQSGSATSLSSLPPGLVGLLQQIPTGNRGWTKETRDSFVGAFIAVLDFTVPTSPIGLEDLTDEDLIDSDEEQEFDS